MATVPELVNEASRLFLQMHFDLTKEEILRERLINARRAELELTDALGTEFLPGADFVKAIQAAASWADVQAKQQREALEMLSALERESRLRVSFLPPALETVELQVAIQRLWASQASERLKALR